MKQLKLIGPLFALVLLTACAALDKGADPLVVRAEQSIRVGFDTLDVFLHLDQANRQLWTAMLPDVHQFAEHLREPVGTPPTARGIAWIESATRTKDAYKRNRTPENKVNLITALATLDTLLAETQRHLDSTTPTP